MFYRARQAVNRAWFNANIRDVLLTPALPSADAEVVLASMLCHRDVLMYLVAAKSLVHHLSFTPQTVVLDDGSLTPEDVSLLQRHIPGFRTIPITSIDRGRCPKGGAWELLLMMTELIRESYVIQLDSDTLTFSPTQEVIDAVQKERTFTMLGDRSFPQIEPMLSACARSKGNMHPHVQAVVERTFDELPEAASLKYVRGNAGFLGFRKNAFNRERVEWFSDLMRGLAGERWNQWGSEQITTNLLVANTGDSFALSPAEYLTYWAHQEIDYDAASFLHFVGPCRWHAGYYRRKAREVIKNMMVSS